MPAFLTDDWFATVENLTAQAGDLNLPPALANLAINLVVTDAAGGQRENNIKYGCGNFTQSILRI